MLAQVHLQHLHLGVFRRVAHAEHHHEAVHLGGGERVGALVVEGEPDFLTWATRFSDANETAPGVIGVGSGAWSKGLADRIPDRARVIVRTHDDRAGQKYAAEVIDTLGARCDVRVPKGAS